MKSKKIKLIKKAPNNIKNIIDDKISLALSKYFTKVTPEMLNNFSSLVKRKIEEISDVKDTEDYNMDLVSEIIDRGACIFMMAGQKSSYYGDVIRSIVAHKTYLQTNTDSVSFTIGLKDTNYKTFPFSQTVAGELRAKFILQTEKSDNYKKMIQTVDSLIINYISIQDWELIKNAMKKAEERIFKEELMFLNPTKSFEHGELQELTEKEADTFGITKMNEVIKDEKTGLDVIKDGKKIFIDKRRDGHDLLSLKDLVLILENKKNFEYMSIGPGFFGKYMPELKEAGIDGLIFKSVDEKLTEIKVVRQFRNKYKQNIHFSPVKAALLLAQEYSMKITKEEFKYTDHTKGGIEISHLDYEFKGLTEDFIKQNERYYVLVDGMISSPSLDKLVLDYEANSLNTEQVPCAEVFLFENRTNMMATRLYFTPYSPKKLHIVNQHGSVVFGNNDQSLHSCSMLSKATKEEYYEYMKIFPEGMKGWENKNEIYSPALVAALIHEVRTEHNYPTDLFLDEYESVWNNVALSIYEMSYFTAYFEISKLALVHTMYSDPSVPALIKKMLSNYSPLTKRFLLKNYVNDGKCTEEIQDSWYNHLAEEKKDFESHKTNHMIAELSEIEKLMIQYPNLTFTEIKKMAQINIKNNKE
jgi:hypothetical protein